MSLQADVALAKLHDELGVESTAVHDIDFGDRSQPLARPEPAPTSPTSPALRGAAVAHVVVQMSPRDRVADSDVMMSPASAEIVAGDLADLAAPTATEAEEDSADQKTVERTMSALSAMGSARNRPPIDPFTLRSVAEREKFVSDFSLEQLPAVIKRIRQAGMAEPTASISFRNLFYKKQGVILVNGVSGYLKPGMLVAIMGDRATPLLEVQYCGCDCSWDYRTGHGHERQYAICDDSSLGGMGDGQTAHVDHSAIGAWCCAVTVASPSVCLSPYLSVN